MISGIGVDICCLSRMEKLIRNAHFVERVFSPEEREYAESKARPVLHYASSFAAREAFAKASGISLAKVVFGGVSISRTDRGPKLIMSNQVSLCCREKFQKSFISLSHDGNYAVAMVVLEV